MNSAKYLGNQTVEVSAFTPVKPGPEQVQIRVAYVGLCGTDLHIVHGAMDKRIQIPLSFGHEMSGIIEAVGTQVTAWKPGNLVTVMPLDWDGTCPACISGYQHICQNLNFVGIDSPGALQTLWNVDQSWLIRLPETMSLLHAALIEPVAVAVHDVERAQLSAGEKILVVGGGPIGLLIGIVARTKGAEVIITELDANRRQLIESLGFVVLNPTETDLTVYIKQWTNDKGADSIFEVSGSAQAVLESIELVKVRGKLVIVAIHPQPRQMNLQRVFWRELSIIGVRVYEKSDFETAIQLINDGAIPSEKIISKVLPLSQISQAIKILEKGLAMKILIDVQEAGVTS
jgi:(R,R)-butanediol dehydrogenase/meso-butanediol dehydrogenase/diacetyl reductase